MVMGDNCDKCGICFQAGLRVSRQKLREGYAFMKCNKSKNTKTLGSDIELKLLLRSLIE